MLERLQRLVNGLLFRLRTGYSEKSLLKLYSELARLDYREPQTYKLSDGQPFSITTMKGGPRITLFPNYEILLKYSNTKRQLYIQVNEEGTNSVDDWQEVYRTGAAFKTGPWFPVLIDLSKHCPCVPTNQQGFL